MAKPRTLALQLKSKALNFKFRIPHNLLPAARFSLILKFRKWRLILKSVPHSRSWLKSKLCRIITVPSPKPKPKLKPSIPQNKSISESVNWQISQLSATQGIQKVVISVTLYLLNNLFTCPARNQLLLLVLVSILLIFILSFRALLNFRGSLLSNVWWVATSFVDAKDVLSKISAAMGRIEEPAFQIIF